MRKEAEIYIFDVNRLLWEGLYKLIKYHFPEKKVTHFTTLDKIPAGAKDMVLYVPHSADTDELENISTWLANNLESSLLVIANEEFDLSQTKDLLLNARTGIISSYHTQTELPRAIIQLMKGNNYISQYMYLKNRTNKASDVPGIFQMLTEEELRILICFTSGMSATDISDVLTVTKEEAENTLNIICIKLGGIKHHELTELAKKHDLI